MPLRDSKLKTPTNDNMETRSESRFVLMSLQGTDVEIDAKRPLNDGDYLLFDEMPERSSTHEWPTKTYLVLSS